MLPLLEQHLALPAGSLHAALPGGGRLEGSPARESGRRFTPGSIDVFTSWQGTLLYALLLLGLIHLLNLQQFRLASQGLLSTRPLPPAVAPPAAGAVGADAALLEAFPDLRPISQAAAGQGLRVLRGEVGSAGPDLSLAILSVTTARPTRVEIRSRLAGSSRLVGVEGELAIPVLPPFQLQLSPDPPQGSVRWRGVALEPLPDQPGRYAFPLPPSSGSKPQAKAEAQAAASAASHP